MQHALVTHSGKLGDATTRQVLGRLLLSTILVLGIVQWSFLPILIQSGPLLGSTIPISGITIALCAAAASVHRRRSTGLGLSAD